MKEPVIKNESISIAYAPFYKEAESKTRSNNKAVACNFDLNVLPSTNTDEHPFEDCGDYVPIYSINASMFEGAQSKDQVMYDFDLNALPSTYIDELFEDCNDYVPISSANASLFEDVKNKARAKDQDVMYCINLNASPVLDTDEPQLKDDVDYMEYSSIPQVINKMRHEVTNGLTIAERPLSSIDRLCDAPNPFDTHFNASIPSNACDPFDGFFGCLGPSDTSCFSQRFKVHILGGEKPIYD